MNKYTVILEKIEYATVQFTDEDMGDGELPEDTAWRLVFPSDWDENSSEAWIDKIEFVPDSITE